ncbi:MAG: hypothetical protein OXG51_01130, partial [Gammaproteobacteria bacterium]|nr:hypothetical protein [Gammaproteobacteria bacterium]
ATADPGHRLSGWSGACSGTGTCTVTLSADATVGATIKPTRTLTVAAPSNGKVTGKAGAATVIDCGSDCTETVLDGTTVALTATGTGGYAFESWGGACASETTAGCTVTLDADKSVSVAFASTAIVGKCDESVVDGCAAGTLNSAAHSDTDADHHWRCDGANGGADSPKCGKAKAGCGAGSRRWAANGNACTGSVTRASSGQTRTATDGGDPTRGSALFKCDDGAWTEQSGSTCTVALGCGSRENSCLPTGVNLTDTADTAAKNGQCASTEASGCRNETTFQDRTDVSLENGVCGSGTDQCVRGRYVSRGDTTRKNQWHCQGIDAEDRWACQGIDGSNNWNCSYGSQSQSCSVPVSAADRSCSDITAYATDAHCFTCKPCTGANEELDSDCSCVCKAGYHRHNRACVENPMCSSPMAENACKVGSPASFANSAVDGQCKGTEADPCSAGAYRDLSDAAPQNGVCGTSKDACNPGTAVNKKSVTGKYTWDCAGIAGSKNWRCVGANGSKTWDCKSGGQTQECSLAASGTSVSCSETVAASTYTGCFACKSGYELHDGGCVAECGSNETRNSSGVCACKAGYERDGGVCKRFFILTVIVDPARAGRVTDPDNGIDCTSTCSYKLAGGTGVNLTKSSGAGWNCLIEGNSRFTLNKDTTKRLNCSTTLIPNAGGPYTAVFSGGALPFGGFLTLYTANVSASATGGVSPYTFRWEGRTADSASAIYIFTIRETYEKDVTATDSATPPGSDKATATIHAGTSGTDSAQSGGEAQGGSEEAVPFEVPLGGELNIVWGEDSAITASSGDAAVVGVSVASPRIRLTGVGAGTAAVVVQTDAGELRLPVEVK